MKQFATDLCNASCHSQQKTSISSVFGSFVDNELRLLDSCSTVLNNDFDDFQAQATLSATYILWLTKVIAIFFFFSFVLFNIPFCNFGGIFLYVLQQIPEFQSELQEKKLTAGNLKSMLSKMCPEKAGLWDSLMGLDRNVWSVCVEVNLFFPFFFPPIMRFTLLFF